MYLDELTDKELELLALVEAGAPLWLPDPGNGPQTMAYLSDANIVGFGGAAGGGKTDLVLGKALNQHTDSMVMRRIGTELQPVIDRLLRLVGSRGSWTGGNTNILRLPGDRTIAFGSVPNPGDETKYQGHPHDFKAYDEATNFSAETIRFLSTWLRNTRVPGQVCEQMFAFNPPQTSDGRWVIQFFAPWLDRQHPRPAAYGEVRHFVTVPHGNEQLDVEVPNQRCVIVNNEPRFDFNPEEHKPVDIITPTSRTFIGSKVTDNKHQSAQYITQLQSLPEPLRSQMLNGDFYAGISDSEWQVIPTAWVEAAMERWKPRDRKGTMDSMGVDVARGGSDNTVIARRHDNWYDLPLVTPGRETPDGNACAALVVAALRDRAPVHIDVVGVGGSPRDFLATNYFQVIGVNGGEARGLEGKHGQGGLRFANWKSYVWWRMREDLDPANGRGIALPPDQRLKKDLVCATWRPVGGRIRVESREDIIKRLKRSPDWASAYLLAGLDTPRIDMLPKPEQSAGGGHDPLAMFG